MKKLFVFCLALMLLASIAGCAADLAEGTVPGTTQPTEAPLPVSLRLPSYVSRVNSTEDPSIHTMSLNADKMAISSVRHLPIYKCESLDALETFKDQFKDILSLSSGYNDGPSFEDITQRFDAGFFESNTLLLVYVLASSGTFRFDLESCLIDGTALCANIVQTNDPEAFTDDMAGWLVAIPVSNDLLQAVESYDAVMQ